MIATTDHLATLEHLGGSKMLSGYILRQHSTRRVS